MKERFEAFGRWRVASGPEQEEIEFRGKLTWDPFKGASLEASDLNARLAAFFDRKWMQGFLIHGQLDNMPLVTIRNAMMIEFNPDILGIGMSRATFSASELSKGDMHVDDIDSVEFSSLTCEISGLAGWVGGGMFESSSDGGVTIVKCNSYHAVDFAEADGLKLKIAKFCALKRGRLEFTATSIFAIEVSGELPFRFLEGMSVLEDFKSFLTIALDRPVFFETIRGQLRSDGDSSRFDQIEFFRTSDESLVSRDKNNSNDNLEPFHLEPLGRTAAAFGKFREIYRRNRMSLDFFLSQIYGSESFINQQFADMVHGLEGLHRGLRGGTFMDQATYDEEVLPLIVAALPDCLDRDHRTALKKRMEFGNEFSLRRRLKDLARFHDDYAASVIGKPADFAESVTVLRNQLAHAIGEGPPDKSHLLRYLIQLHRVRLLFQLELFYHLGFDEEFLRACVPRVVSSRIIQNNAARLEC